MEIHNLMEDEVFRRVNEICDEEEQSGGAGYCTSRACRLDAVCYVLNRLPPRYASSGRGLAHVERDIAADTQLAVDITKLAHEGLQRISSVRRSYYDQDGETTQTRGPCFNFPAITGRILDGESFFPVDGATVYLLYEGEPMEMYDARWQNPYVLAAHTYGTYSFWPKPLPADSVEASVALDLQIVAEAEGFERLEHFFTVELAAEASATGTRRIGGDHHLPDLYMFSA
ncbi:MAG: late competence development ComFB family protein [Spirochaetaceae bacterium]